MLLAISEDLAMEEKMRGMKMLVSAGADLTLRDNINKTLFDYPNVKKLLNELGITNDSVNFV